MINNPTIFIIYEKGQFGTFLSSLFMHHPTYTSREVVGLDSNTIGFNAHRSGYEDHIEHFHNHQDADRLLAMDSDQQINFFAQLEKVKGLAIHRLAGWNWSNIDFKKYFSNYAVVYVVPKIDRIPNYASRWFHSTATTYHEEWWYKNFKNKNIDSVPQYFLEKMSTREKEKWLIKEIKTMQNKTIDGAHEIVVDPDDLADHQILKNVTTGACKILGIEDFDLPMQDIKTFLEKNKKFLDLQ